MNLGNESSSDLAAPPGGWPAPQAAYVHVPFCRHRCGYCNFSIVAGREDLVDRFLTALDRELEALQRPGVQTVFIGGGTPTHLNPDQLCRLMRMIRQRFALASEFEWTIEANPEDVTSEKLDLIVEHGVNRISLGVQSFDDRKLMMLERGHSGHAARLAIDRTVERVANVSIDLIFAAPGESLESWRRDLDTAVSMPISHLSTYNLTYEKGTSFWSRRYHGELEPTLDSLEVEMYAAAQSTAAAAGLDHYEISNFARPGNHCRHNLAYWQGQGWFASGPGAARFVDGRRELNHRSTTTYLRRIENGQSPTAECEPISVLQYARERAAFGIRMLEGIDLNRLSTQCGVDLSSQCGEAISQSMSEGLLAWAGERLRLTSRGILFADTVASRMLG